MSSDPIPKNRWMQPSPSVWRIVRRLIQHVQLSPKDDHSQCRKCQRWATMLDRRTVRMPMDECGHNLTMSYLQ